MANDLLIKCVEEKKCKWSVNHVCRRKEMTVLIGAKVDEKEEDEKVIVEEIEEDGEIKTVNISWDFVVGTTNTKTIKLMGKIENEDW